MKLVLVLRSLIILLIYSISICSSMSEIQPALLTQLELEWLLGKTSNLSKKTERDLRYRINKKVRIFMQTELPLLKDRGFAAALGNDAAAISSGGDTGERSLVGREIANPEEKSNDVVSDKKDKGAGSGNIVSTAPFSAFSPRHFEPMCPFGHEVSNFREKELENHLKLQKTFNYKQIFSYTEVIFLKLIKKE